jgi:hypothetical protein
VQSVVFAHTNILTRLIIDALLTNQYVAWNYFFIPFLITTTTEKIGDKFITIDNGDPVLLFSEHLPVISHLAVLTPRIIALFDTEKHALETQFTPFYFIEFCLEKMCKTEKRF